MWVVTVIVSFWGKKQPILISYLLAVRFPTMTMTFSEMLHWKDWHQLWVLASTSNNKNEANGDATVEDLIRIIAPLSPHPFLHSLTSSPSPSGLTASSNCRGRRGSAWLMTNIWKRKQNQQALKSGDKSNNLSFRCSDNYPQVPWDHPKIWQIKMK